jgi:hypothetical protein
MEGKPADVRTALGQRLADDLAIADDPSECPVVDPEVEFEARNRKR